MSEPTNYDMLQDQSIDEIRDIVTTTYLPPDQTEYSYPVVDQPMNDEQWQYTSLAQGVGVMDEGGQPYWLRLNGSEANTNSTNTMLLTVSKTRGTAQATLRGFYHRLMADKVLSFPGVTTATTYYVLLQFNPLGHKEPTGPISVQVVTSLSTSQGKHNCVLWTVQRSPNQLLTDAIVTQVRPKIAPTITVDTDEQRLAIPVHSLLWGTLCMVHSTGEIFRAMGSSSDEESGGPTGWRSLTDPDWSEPGDTSTYKWPGHGFKRGMQRVGKTRKMRGRIARVNGENFNTNNSSGYQLWSLSANDTPKYTTSFITTGSGYASPKYSRIEVNGEEAPADVRGTVRVYVAENTPWVSLDGVAWDME